jgi:hypothetical protein
MIGCWKCRLALEGKSGLDRFSGAGPPILNLGIGSVTEKLTPVKTPEV